MKVILAPTEEDNLTTHHLFFPTGRYHIPLSKRHAEVLNDAPASWDWWSDQILRAAYKNVRCKPEDEGFLEELIVATRSSIEWHSAYLHARRYSFANDLIREMEPPQPPGQFASFLEQHACHLAQLKHRHDMLGKEIERDRARWSR